jgi:hypothetical protein
MVAEGPALRGINSRPLQGIVLVCQVSSYTPLLDSFLKAHRLGAGVTVAGPPQLPGAGKALRRFRVKMLGVIMLAYAALQVVGLAAIETSAGLRLQYVNLI